MSDASAQLRSDLRWKRRRQAGFAVRASALGLCILAMSLGVKAEEPVALSKAIEIRQLSPEEAERGRVVRLRGTITFLSRTGANFLQDETAGIFFSSGKKNLRPGDFVEVIGPTHMGRYLPGLDTAQFRVLSHGVLPPAVAADYDDLISGRFHYQRVAIEGIGRSQTLEGGRTCLRVAMGTRIVEVLVESPLNQEATFVDCHLRIEGLAAGRINSRRQLVQPFVRIADLSAITVIEPAPPEGLIPLLPASDLLTFRPSGQGEHRVRVEGIVTDCFHETAFLRNATTAFAVHFSSPAKIAVGDQIAVLGFPQLDASSSSIADAKIASQRPGPAPLPTEATIGELLSGSHDFDLVSVTALVTDSVGGGDGVVILTLQSDEGAIRSRVPYETTPLVGAFVQVVGICQVESNVMIDDYRMLPKGITVVMRNAKDLAILRAAPWWTKRRLTTMLAVLGAIVCGTGLWIVVLRRQVARQTVALRERMSAEGALQERQRIARDFHDTLEQELAGLTLRLDAAATRVSDEKGSGLLAASRNLVARIQSETRNLISDLRTPSEDLGDVAAALREIADRTSEYLRVHLEIPEGRVPRIPAITVHQLRMIVNECITNVIKHAHATAVTIRLQLEDARLTVVVADDGCGCGRSIDSSAKAGHFGLTGIRERCRRIGAGVTWTSEPGKGTTVTICVAIDSTRIRTDSSPHALI